MIKASTTPTGFIRIYFDENLIYSEVQASGGSRTAATSKMERFVIIVNSVFLCKLFKSTYGGYFNTCGDYFR